MHAQAGKVASTCELPGPAGVGCTIHAFLVELHIPPAVVVHISGSMLNAQNGMAAPHAADHHQGVMASAWLHIGKHTGQKLQDIPISWESLYFSVGALQGPGQQAPCLSRQSAPGKAA